MLIICLRLQRAVPMPEMAFLCFGDKDKQIIGRLYLMMADFSTLTFAAHAFTRYQPMNASRNRSFTLYRRVSIQSRRRPNWLASTTGGVS